MQSLVGIATALVVLDEDLEFSETIKRRYACRGYDVSIGTETSAAVEKPCDILLFRYSRSSDAQLKSWAESSPDPSGVEIIMLARDEILGRAAEFVPPSVTDLQRLPLNWIELDWRLQRARERRQQQPAAWSRSPRYSSPVRSEAVETGEPVGQYVVTDAASPVTIDATLEAVQRAHVQNILTREKWNKARTARVLGVNRRSLYRLIARLGLKQQRTEGVIDPSDL